MYGQMVCQYASCIDCCISYSSVTCADPDLASGDGDIIYVVVAYVVGASHPTYSDIGPDL